MWEILAPKRGRQRGEGNRTNGLLGVIGLGRWRGRKGGKATTEGSIGAIILIYAQVVVEHGSKLFFCLVHVGIQHLVAIHATDKILDPAGGFDTMEGRSLPKPGGRARRGH